MRDTDHDLSVLGKFQLEHSFDPNDGKENSLRKRWEIVKKEYENFMLKYNSGELYKEVHVTPDTDTNGYYKSRFDRWKAEKEAELQNAEFTLASYIQKQLDSGKSPVVGSKILGTAEAAGTANNIHQEQLTFRDFLTRVKTARYNAELPLITRSEGYVNAVYDQKGVIVRDHTIASRLETMTSGEYQAQENWGFRFHYNPSSITEAFSAPAGINYAGFIHDIANDPLYLMPNQSGVTFSFSLMLNRRQDMWVLNRKDWRDLYPEDKAPTLEDREAILSMGTQYDIEHFFRVVNLDPVDTWRAGAEKSSDWGMMMGTPVVVSFGKPFRNSQGHRMFRAQPVSLSFSHDMYSPGMVPMYSTLEFTFTRIPDLYGYTKTESAPEIEKRWGADAAREEAAGPVDLEAVEQFYIDNDSYFIGIAADRANLVRLALRHLGYKETANNGNKFGESFKRNHEPWCGFFIMYVMKEAGITSPPYLAHVPTALANVKKAGKFFTTAPQPGDLVFTKWNKTPSESDHIGIVVDGSEWSSKGRVKAVEGNAGANTDRVWTGWHDKKRVVGFGKLY